MEQSEDKTRAIRGIVVTREQTILPNQDRAAREVLDRFEQQVRGELRQLDDVLKPKNGGCLPHLWNDVLFAFLRVHSRPYLFSFTASISQTRGQRMNSTEPQSKPSLQ